MEIAVILTKCSVICLFLVIMDYKIYNFIRFLVDNYLIDNIMIFGRR